jgi:hypothetical protein
LDWLKERRRRWLRVDEEVALRGKLIKISIQSGVSAKDDQRDFAYVVVSWKDKSNKFHQFRERWIKDRGKWFTRVIGLVPVRPES